MVRTSLVLGCSCAALIACTNDYDQFSFGGGEGQGAGATASQTGPGPSGSTSSGPGASTSTGAPTSSVTSSVASTTAMASSSTGGSGNTVPCGPPATCDLDAGEICCFDEGSQNVECDATAMCTSNDAELRCNGPQDCMNGDRCCFEFSGMNLEGTICQPMCTGPELCDPAIDPNTCPMGESCVDSTLLPDGYFRCG